MKKIFRQHRSFSAICLGLALALTAGPTGAVETEVGLEGPILGYLSDGSLSEAAGTFLTERPWLTNGSGFEQMIPMRSLEENGQIRVFFRVEIEGRRIVGAQVFLLADSRSRAVLKVDGNLSHAGAPDLEPAIAASEAIAQAATRAGLGPWAPTDDAILQYFLDDTDGPILAWSQPIERRVAGDPVHEWIYVDAMTGDLLAQMPGEPHLALRFIPATPLSFDVAVGYCYGENWASWNESFGATRYELQGADNTNFNGGTIEYSGPATDQAINLNFWNSPRYYRVRACNSQGCSSYTGHKTARYVACCF